MTATIAIYAPENPTGHCATIAGDRAVGVLCEIHRRFPDEIAAGWIRSKDYPSRTRVGFAFVSPNPVKEADMIAKRVRESEYFKNDTILVQRLITGNTGLVIVRAATDTTRLPELPGILEEVSSATWFLQTTVWNDPQPAHLLPTPYSLLDGSVGLMLPYGSISTFFERKLKDDQWGIWKYGSESPRGYKYREDHPSLLGPEVFNLYFAELVDRLGGIDRALAWLTMTNTGPVTCSTVIYPMDGGLVATHLNHASYSGAVRARHERTCDSEGNRIVIASNYVSDVWPTIWKSRLGLTIVTPFESFPDGAMTLQLPASGQFNPKYTGLTTVWAGRATPGYPRVDTNVLL